MSKHSCTVHVTIFSTGSKILHTYLCTLLHIRLIHSVMWPVVCHVTSSVCSDYSCCKFHRKKLSWLPHKAGRSLGMRLLLILDLSCGIYNLHVEIFWWIRHVQPASCKLVSFAEMLLFRVATLACHVTTLACHVTTIVCHVITLACHVITIVCHVITLACHVITLACHVTTIVCHVITLACHVITLACHVITIVCHVATSASIEMTKTELKKWFTTMSFW